MRRLMYLLVLAGCGRVAFDPLGAPDAPASPQTWGDHANELPVGACTGAPLVVTDTTDDLDGPTTISDPNAAGPTLSFVEALWIAENRAGRDAITFDPEVFPTDNTVPIILDGGTGQLPTGISDVCIDGRARGVIVSYQACGTVCPPSFGGSLLVGLTFLDMGWELVLNSSQIAGCRLNTDGMVSRDGTRTWTVEVSNSAPAGFVTQIGPGNVIVGDTALRLFEDGAGTIEVFENGIGYDLLTGIVIPTGDAIDARDGSSPNRPVIRDNVIAVAGSVSSFAASNLGTDYIGNHIGVDRAGNRLPGSAGFRLTSGALLLMGNVIEGVPFAVAVMTGSAVVTGNRITGNAMGIVYQGVPPVAAPVLLTATTTSITGMCAASGTVEVFLDPGNQGAELVGSTPCGAGFFSVGGTFSSGLNATATLTVAGGTSSFSAPVAIP